MIKEITFFIPGDPEPRSAVVGSVFKDRHIHYIEADKKQKWFRIHFSDESIMVFSDVPFIALYAR